MQNLFRRVSIEMIAVLALAVASLSTQAMAQANTFLQIAGVPGESADAGHLNWIDVSSTSVGVVGPQQQIFHLVTTSVTVASPTLLLATASGQHFSNVVVAVRRGARSNPDYLRYILTDVVVVNYSVVGNDGTAPGEKFDLTYSALQIEYRQQRPDGTYGPPTITCWDFVLGTPCG